MNRHQRRRAEARARKQAWYHHRLLTAFHRCPTMADELRCRAVHAVIAHDPACSIYAPRRRCTCTPDISLVPFDGGDGIYVIDERGQARKSSRQ